MTNVPAIAGTSTPGVEPRTGAGTGSAQADPRPLPPAARVEISGASRPAAPAQAVPVDADPVVLRAMASWAAPAAVREIAGRRNLDPATSRAVYGRGDWTALRALAANTGSALPDDVLDGLIEASRLDARLGAALVSRGDLPASKAALAARQNAAAAAEGRTGEASGIVVGDTRDRVTGSLTERGGKADEAVDLLAKLRPLRPADIAYCLSLGKIDEAMSVISKLAGVPTPAAIRAYESGDVGYALQQMRSIGLDTATANWLLAGLGRLPSAPSETQAATRAYASAAQSAERRPAGPTIDFRI
jgi:hypothetical protein